MGSNGSIVAEVQSSGSSWISLISSIVPIVTLADLFRSPTPAPGYEETLRLLRDAAQGLRGILVQFHDRFDDVYSSLILRTSIHLRGLSPDARDSFFLNMEMLNQLFGSQFEIAVTELLDIARRINDLDLPVRS